MHAVLPRLTNTDFPAISRAQLDTLQVNLGYRCNMTCLHCHVNAGPNRKEKMDPDTIDQVIESLSALNIQTLDLTGGAPEMHPQFKQLVSAATALGVTVIDRCNLTILQEPDFEDFAQFLADHRVTIVASLPCYLEDNVNAQRGKGAFEPSIAALQKLNQLGYGQPGSNLELNLVFNPQGPTLPPPQQALEQDYKAHLKEHYNVVFNQLFSLANMPIQRFGSTLISRNQFDDYMGLLKGAHQDDNLNGVMCRTTLSVDYRGHLYDCDFNQMLELPLRDNDGSTMTLRSLARSKSNLERKDIIVAEHCYGCTAGQGSSCGGALA